MNKKVKIKKLPQFRGGGMFGPQTPPRDAFSNPHIQGSEPVIKLRTTLEPTSKENATLKAEKNETVLTNLQGEGIPEFFIVGGKPHSRGGTPLNLPANSFFFSQNKHMAIKDPGILAMFGKTAKKAYSPAEISKQYNLNKYRQILLDPLSTKLEKNTAEKMIKNYNMKLGALALAQESIKGFDNGIPMVALGYMEENSIRPEELIGQPLSTPNEVPQFKGGGQYNTVRKVRIKSLPMYQDAGETKTTVRKVYDIPKNAVKWDPDKAGYDESQVQPGHYIRQRDGSWKIVEGYADADFTGTLDSDQRLGQFTKGYSMINEKLQNSELQNEIVKRYYADVEKLQPTGKLSQADIETMKTLSPEEIIANFLDILRKNLAFNSKYGNIDDIDFNKELDKNPDLANQKLMELGYEPTGIANIGAFQATYNVLHDIAKDPSKKELVKGLNLRQVGTYNPSQSIDPEGRISKVDGFWGNTTLGQTLLPAKDKLKLKDVSSKEVTDETKHLGEPLQEAPSRWWTQDLINTAGAASDYFTAKQYNPWQATPQWQAINPEFVDFRGAAARIGSQGRGLANVAAQFAGPQSQAALQQNIQRGIVDPLLKVQEMENASNIETANKFNMFNTQSKNQYNMQKAALDTQLFDKQTIANQQFDNSKRAFKWNAINAFNQGLTNAGKTQTMNSLRDNFMVDPRTGQLHFTGDARRIKPGTQNTVFEDTVDRLLREHPDWDANTAIAVAKGNQGKPDNEGLPLGVNLDGIYPFGQ